MTAKSLRESSWAQRSLFFIAGVLVAVACGTIGSPWLAGIGAALVLIWRIVKGPFVRAGSYVVGTVAPVAVFIGWLGLGPVVADHWHRQTFNPETWLSRLAGFAPLARHAVSEDGHCDARAASA
jgi:hypothetical protein